MNSEAVEFTIMDRLLRAVESLACLPEEEGGSDYLRARALDSAVSQIVPLAFDHFPAGVPECCPRDAHQRFCALLDAELARMKERGSVNDGPWRFYGIAYVDERELRKAIFQLFRACYYHNLN